MRVHVLAFFRGCFFSPGFLRGRVSKYLLTYLLTYLPRRVFPDPLITCTYVRRNIGPLPPPPGTSPARALLVPMLIGFRLSRRAHFHHDSYWLVPSVLTPPGARFGFAASDPSPAHRALFRSAGTGAHSNRRGLARLR